MYENFALWGAAPHSVSLGAPHISETTGARKFPYGQVHFYGMKLSHYVACQGRNAPIVNWGPLISRKLLELES